MMELFIAPNGRVRCLYSEDLDLGSLGCLTIRRASHVEPIDNGCWTADLSPIGGPTLGPFAQRSQALAAEVGWIEGHLPSIPG
jgi:hypothetical protein